MRVRLAAVLLLAALAFGVRATSIYLRYLSTELSSAPPFRTEVVRGRLLVASVDPAADCYRGWHGHARPEAGDEVLGVFDAHGRGGPIHGLFDYGLYLRPINVEEPWTLVVGRTAPGGTERLSLAMPPSVPITWSNAEWLANIGSDFYLPFLAIMTGLLIGLLRWRDNAAWLASLLFLALGLAVVPCLEQFGVGWRDVVLFLQVSAAHLLPYLVFRFFLRFPARSLVDTALPWLNAVFAIETAVACAAGLIYDFSRYVSLQSARRLDELLAQAGLTMNGIESVFTTFSAAMLVAALASVILNVRHARSRDERRRLRIIATGAVTGLLPAALMFGAAATGTKVPVGLLVVAIPLIGLFPLSFAYAVVRHRVFGIRVIVRRGLTYALVSRGFLLTEAAIIFAGLLALSGTVLQWVEPRPSLAASTGGTALATFMLTLGMRRVNRRVLPVIDRRFFRDAYDGRRILNDLGRAVRQMASHPQQLLEHVTRQIATALHPRGVAVFLAPGACSTVVPLASSDARCCELPLGPGSPTRFALCVQEPTAKREALSSQESRLFVAQSPLGAHLAGCAAGEPEALDVLVFESPEASARGGDGAPADRAELARGGAPEADCVEENELLAHFDARLVVPLVTAGRVLGFLLLSEKRSEEPYSREDKELLLAVAGQVAIALDYAELIGQAAEQAALRREVQIAQEVQRQLFPHERPPLRSLRYAGVCRAARGVGGDFYDFLPLASDRLGIALADIAGKGLPAALLMASLQALTRSHAPTHVEALPEMTRELNRHLLESTDGARFATLFFGVYDDRARRLRYVNAGHLAPLVVRRGDDGQLLVCRLEIGGMVLGLFPEQQYEEGCAVLSPGDRLVVFSDGVTEAANPSGDMFGEERLVAALRTHAGDDIERLPALVLDAVGRFVGASPQQDDITIIAAEVR